jgi:dipeptidyl aminopeptidase/acylaminoacyl peptidase
MATFRDGKAVNPALLFRNDTAARYTPASGGRILFVRNDNLYAQRLDLRKRSLEGDAELLVQGVASAPIAFVAHFSVSRTGIVAWRAGRAGLSQVTVFDRQGHRIGTAGPPSPVRYLVLSPDEKRFLAGSGNNAWLIEPDLPGRLSLGEVGWSLWSPDGKRLLGQDGLKVVERSLLSNDTREVAKLNQEILLNAITPDGKVLVYQGAEEAVFSMRLDGPSQGRIPQSLLRTGETINNPCFSPDGHWLVYQARTAENQELGIYVQPFPGPGLRKQIATSGRYPMWRSDEKEIVYYDQDRIWSVRVDSSGGGLRAAAPESLFAVSRPPGLVVPSSPLAISRDGSRIFFPHPVEQPADSQFIHVMTGWAK